MCRYEAVAEHAAALRRPYDTLAALLKCDADEIAIVQVLYRNTLKINFLSCCAMLPFAAFPPSCNSSRTHPVGSHATEICAQAIQHCRHKAFVPMVRPQSATTAWQQAFFGLQWRQGDRILTSVQEYATNYINFLQVGLLSESQSSRVPQSESID
jgi:hypothetical protein